MIYRLIRLRDSIVWRLAGLFLLSSFVMLAMFSTILYLGLKHVYEVRQMEELAGKVELVRHILAELRTIEDVERFRHRLDDLLVGHNDLHIVFFDKDGSRKLFESARLGTSSAQISARAVAESVSPATSWTWIAPGGRQLKMVAAWGSLGGAKHERVLFGLFLETGETLALLEEFRHILLLTLVVGTSLAALLGYWIASRGLKPLSGMASSAKHISASQLDIRLGLADIPTELRDLASAFNEMLGRLEDAFRRQSDLSSDIAHELRTPVNNLLLQGQVALSKSRSPEQYQQVLASIIEESQHMGKMIEEMLFLARADNAEAVLDKGEVSLREEVRGLLDFYEVMMEEKGIQCQLDGQATVVADRALLRRAIGNLLSNAVKYTPGGGTVSISIQSSPEWSRVKIRNPGPGIAAPHLCRIFDRFYRIDHARTDSRQSTGLGLAIVRSIAILHGGEVTVESLPGAWAEFTLELPSNSRRTER